jgi:hypothetical protein
VSLELALLHAAISTDSTTAQAVGDRLDMRGEEESPRRSDPAGSQRYLGTDASPARVGNRDLGRR